MLCNTVIIARPWANVKLPAEFSGAAPAPRRLTKRAALPIIYLYPEWQGGNDHEKVYGCGQPAPQAGQDLGQVQAIDRMIDEDVPCEDILAQINAAKSALHGCGKVVLEGHIQHCVRDGIQHGDADKTIESFTKAVERFSNMS